LQNNNFRLQLGINAGAGPAKLLTPIVAQRRAGFGVTTVASENRTALLTGYELSANMPHAWDHICSIYERNASMQRLYY
jgi:hypothetical protein